MHNPTQPTKLVRFDAFELNLKTGELRKGGTKVRLRGQSFHILAALLERPGKLVTRESLHERLWPEDTFVDFDKSINIAVSKLRQALGDSADEPRFIETLPRRGYRFIGDVEQLDGASEIVGLPAGVADEGRISRYRLLEKLGEGGMGVVYKAEDTKLGRFVALKFLAPHLLQDEASLKRFEREARAAAGLDHPNICTVHEIDQADGKTFIALAFLDGQTLGAKIAEGQLEIPDVRSIAVQLAEGLAAAHDEGVIHRDMKPDNVMLVHGSKRLVKIMDFGLAQLAGASKLTGDGSTMGTIAYMSPEQAQGDEVDQRSDIWSLGAIVYEMLAGRGPFRGEYDQAIIYSILNEDPEPLSGLREDVPEDLVRIVGKALSKRPESRYPHVDEMRVDLEGQRTASGAGRVARTPSPAPLAKGQLGWYALAGLATLAATFAVFQRTAPPEPVGELPPVELNAKPLSGIVAGSAFFPTFSPNGEQIAFAWTGPEPTSPPNYDIYVKSVNSGEPRRLSSHPSTDWRPRWSPDGRTIVWLRELEGGRRETVEAPAVGGPSHSWGRLGFVSSETAGLMAWTRDSKHLIIHEIVDGKDGLYRRSREGERWRLTSRQDWSPAVSPDGRQLAFARGESSMADADIYLLELSDDGLPVGDPRRITEDRELVSNLSWTPDGSALVYLAHSRGNLRALWRLPISPKGAGRQRLAAASDVSFGVAVAPVGDRLAFARVTPAGELYRMAFEENSLAIGEPQWVAPSPGQDRHPHFSPDGRQLTFSTRRGLYSSIFIADANGQNVSAGYTDSDSIASGPKWAPDGERITFMLESGPGAGVYVMSVDGGEPIMLAPLQVKGVTALKLMPSWSSDGEAVYFTSNRSGRNEVWKQRLGDEATQVTRDGGLYAVESPDGRFLYYTKTAQGPLFRIPPGGGSEEQVADMVLDNGFAVLDDAVYYIIPPNEGTRDEPFRIERYDVQDGRSRVVKVLPKEHSPSSGLTVSPAAGAIVYGNMRSKWEIMVVEDFK